MMCSYFKYQMFLVRGSEPGRVAQSVGHLTRKSRGPGFDTRSGHILSFLLPLIQERGSCQLLAKVCARSTG